MNLQFTHPLYLLALPPALAWVIWLAWKSDVQISAGRRRTALLLRLVIVIALGLAIAGIQWLRPQEGMNVFFLLDRSDSIPSPQQEAALKFVNQAAAEKKKTDAAGVLVFGSEAALESSANAAVNLLKIQAIVGTERTDIAGAIRLGTAAFPERGQKRIVLLSDGNENLGDALAAVLAARSLGVTVDILPLGNERGNDVAMQKLGTPPRVKKGQTFEAKIFIHADQAQKATVRVFRNNQDLGPQSVELSVGKNLFTFPQTLTEPGFYNYTAQVEAPFDSLPQNNRATSFTSVKGDPRVLVISSEPEKDTGLVTALQSAKLETRAVGVDRFPASLPELQSYDSIFISNIAAGDLGDSLMKLLESAVRDFGVGLVCVGGDQTYLAGAYKGTPLEATLPLEMELDSKKVLPPGAVVLVMHGMEFANGNQIARDCAQGVLAALGPQDEMGVVLWDGTEHWLFPLAKVGNKKDMARQIAGMSQGDLPSFQGVMTIGAEGLKRSHASLKHMIVFSDGDPAPPSQPLMNDIVANKITVSTVLISGHAGPQTMQWIADQGKGRFHNVISAADLPQIFIKETMVILKSAISEEPFKPKFAAASELVRGIGGDEYPILKGYVCTQPKARAEVPLKTDKGDPLLAHWQYGLGRAVAFTSDAKAKWASDWIGWAKYKQFWSQTAQWSLRRVENADFTSEISVDKGEGVLSVEAVDDQGNYRNFLNLQSVVVSPKGDRQIVRLEQTGPGRYEVHFPTREVGPYLLNLMDVKDGQVRGSQVLGASVNYSPEFAASEPNRSLLQRIAETGEGKVLALPKPGAGLTENPFLHDRKKTFQPRDFWEWLLKLAVILFTLDVAVRRIQLDREEWLKATATFRRWIFFWQGTPRTVEADVSLTALLARREQVRTTQTAPSEPNPELFRPKEIVILPARPSPDTGGKSDFQPVSDTPTAGKPQTPVSTTSRLLDAKKRAQRK